MSHCRHIMQSIELPAVTNARASGDYHAIGETVIFADAISPSLLKHLIKVEGGGSSLIELSPTAR